MAYKFQLLIIYLLIVSTLACKQRGRVVAIIQNKEYKVEVPPGVVMIANNLFIDETEVTNQYWRDLLQWHKLVFGSTKQLVPLDFGGIQPCDSIYLASAEYYFGHPNFSDYPVTNITKQQALTYCKWRSERVFEIILIRDKYITHYVWEDSTNFFSIDKYFTQSYPTKKFDPNLLIPMYTLPSSNEVKYILESADSSGIKKFEKTSKRKKIDYGYRKCELEHPFPTTIYNSPPNPYGIFNGNNNVSEFMVEDSIYGNNYLNNNAAGVCASTELLLRNPFTGMRCVCRWVTYDEYKKYWEGIR
jgi:hypothetical protein